MNTETKFDKEISKLTQKRAELLKQLEQAPAEKKQKARDLGAAILGGRDPAPAANQVHAAAAQAVGLLEALDLANRQLDELQQKRFEALQEAARAEIAERFQRLEEYGADVIRAIYKIVDNRPAIEAEGGALIELAKQFKLEKEGNQVKNLSFQFPFDKIIAIEQSWREGALWKRTRAAMKK